MEENKNTYTQGHMERTSGTGSSMRRTDSAPAYPAENPNTAVTPYFARVERTTGASVMKVIGIAGTLVFGIATAVTAGAAGIAGGLGFGLVSGITGAGAAVTGVFTAGFLAMGIIGGKNARIRERYGRYRAILSRNYYEEIEKIASEMRLPEKTVIADLKQLTQKGCFKQGHFDDEETTFIASDKIYQQYLATRDQARIREQKQKALEDARETLPADVKALLEQGEEELKKISLARAVIRNPEVMQNLQQTERTCSQIFELIQKEKKLTGNLKTFLNYYLPTTAKLAESYHEMEESAVRGENLRSAMSEIENSLGTVNDAFANLLDSFYQDDAMDVASDISVMKTMLKQDGLTEDAMERMKAGKKEEI
ncbi:MAG: 5-bromo-4-chloroindolyl phosphate hydrolysis family protein [Lachnospiraceae bacterium]|nr:5-bromo-4-chloroindolyl phosphate hydrolysis family protein [Lachnospiraceae bacterium]